LEVVEGQKSEGRGVPARRNTPSVTITISLLLSNPIPQDLPHADATGA